jgi:hypothetical protein
VSPYLRTVIPARRSGPFGYRAWRGDLQERHQLDGEWLFRRQSQCATIADIATEAQYEQFVSPILESLRDLGGTGSPREVIDLASRKLGLSEAERSERTKGGFAACR